MLRAALIGFGSSGKTTLFQLMTSARESSRAAHGRSETAIGISKVPDARLDRLTAMYNPRKRVLATVEEQARAQRLCQFVPVVELLSGRDEQVEVKLLRHCGVRPGGAWQHVGVLEGDARGA